MGYLHHTINSDKRGPRVGKERTGPRLSEGSIGDVLGVMEEIVNENNS